MRLKRRGWLSGSLTVEASLLVPLVTFMIFALILLMLAALEGSRLQAAADGEADRKVMAMTDAGEDTGIIDRLRMIRRARVSKDGNISVPHAGIRAVTGGGLACHAEGEALRVLYVQDWFAKKLLTGWKKEETKPGGD